MVRRLPEVYAKAERFLQRRRPQHEDLPRELLDLGDELAQADSPGSIHQGQFVRHVQQRVSVLHAAIQLKIPLGFLAAPHLLSATTHMIVIMILMKQRRDQRRVHHRHILLPHGLDPTNDQTTAGRCRCAQLSMALRWITPMCSRNALRILKNVSTQQE